MKIFDIHGKEVTTLVNKSQPAGQHTVIFDGSKLTSGVYICQLKANDFTRALKLVLLK